jgi:hypothetical protein
MEIILCAKETADDYLMHHGVKGMKRGVLRWQNKDGSLTPEGYKHYAEMYGWGKKLKKAERLQNKADKAADKAEKASRKADDDYVKSYKAERKNERWSTERRQEKADRAKELAGESKAKSDLLSVKARQAQKKASDYADKLQRKEDKLSKFMNEDGSLNDEALRKYTYTTGVPGERKMSLVGRMIFGREYSNKFNKDHTMSKEDVKAWEEAERKKFDEESEDRRRKVKELDDVHNEIMSGFDDRSDDDKKKLGDRVLKILDDTGNGKFDFGNESGTDATNWRGIRTWLTDRVFEKSGEIDSGYYIPGTNASKARDPINKAIDNLDKRRNEMKKEIGYVRYGPDDYKEWRREEKRLYSALHKDSTWKRLLQERDEAYNKYEFSKSLFGAVLKDIGFNDTPENRRILSLYGWYE